MANIRHKINQLRKVRDHTDSDTALTIYKSMFLPTIDYADFIWDRENKGGNLDLQRLQNKGLRVVYKVKLEKNPDLNTEELHVKSGCEKLVYRRDKHLLYYAFSLKKEPVYIDNRNILTRRHQGVRFKVPHSLKPIVIRSVLYRGISRWNNLKAVYTEIETLWKFKLAIEKDYPHF